MVKRKKKKKLSIKKITIGIIFILIITCLIIYKDKIRNIYLSKTTGYSEETIELSINNKTYEEIKKYNYSKTLEEIINSTYFNKAYIKEYTNITYVERKDFLKNISLLLDLGYKSKNINHIYKVLNDDSVALLIENDYFKDIDVLTSLEYFHEEYLSRYLKYATKSKKEIETVATYVNIGLDNKYYTNTEAIKDQTDILAIVNKYHYLSKDYVPSDLTTVNYKYGWGILRKEAAQAFEKMCEAGLKDGMTIRSGSGYRSYWDQSYIYNDYIARDGQAAADSYSARAGHSEHQTGLAMDIKKGNENFIAYYDAEYVWLTKNSYKYGWILRYPKNKETITGYNYEEWHFRYIGVEEATKVFESGLTYDEYVAKKS